MVFDLGGVLLDRPQLVVEGVGCEAQLLAIQALVALGDQVHGGCHALLQVAELQQRLQQLCDGGVSVRPGPPPTQGAPSRHLPRAPPAATCPGRPSLPCHAPRL